MPRDMPRELFNSFLHFIQSFVEESFQDLRTAQFAFSVRNLAKVLSSTGTAEDLGCAGQGWLFFAFLLPFSLWTMDRVFKVRYSNLRMYNKRSKVKPLLKTHVIFFNFKRPVRLWLPCLSNLLFDCCSLNRSKAVSWTGDGSNRRGPLPVQNVKSRVHMKVFSVLHKDMTGPSCQHLESILRTFVLHYFIDLYCLQYSSLQTIRSPRIVCFLKRKRGGVTLW